jgi:8-oxo-dGTP pyrophosphatase MutT (NUDIX family)
LSVPPRDASTIILARATAAGGYEILLTRRPEEMRFLGGFYVFPGGTVHAADYSIAILQRCRGITGEQAQKMLASGHKPQEALGHWVAVIRELFEEVGVLLCVNEKGRAIELGDRENSRRIERARRAVVEGKLDFGDFLREENLFCDLAQITYFDHWVTPEIYSMRFDTRFYIAALPVAQQALTRSEEVTHSLWVEPHEALARMDRRDFPILPPTTTVLQRLARISTWERLRAEFKLH